MCELKKVKVQTILILDYQKRKDCEVFHWITKLLDSDSDIDEAFKSIHHGIVTKIKNYPFEDWIVLDAIKKHIINIFEC